MLQPLLSLFYPRVCLGCGRELTPQRKIICFRCDYQMPKTNQHEHPDNAFTRKFWGRIEVQFAASLYFFQKDTPIQNLMHQLKYNGKPEIAIELGTKFGKTLRESVFFDDVDLIIPVPLHETKLRKRGYNQAAMFATGLAAGMQKTADNEFLTRYTASASQTTKTREERKDVIDGTFCIENAAVIAAASNKHILLVDDVLTTGATLYGCALPLLTIPNVRLSMATIAMVRD